MSAGIASIALFAPVVASNAVFSARRASRGIDAIDENPLFALANFDIAGAQVLKGGRAAKALAISVDPTMNIAEVGAAETIKEASKAGKFMKGLGKVLSFTAENVNSVIVGAGLIKVLGAKDKLEAYAEESSSLLCMFGAEAGVKKLIGMPQITTDKSGNTIVKKRDGLYKKLFTEKQLNAMDDFFAVKKSLSECTKAQKFLKFVPGAAKGLLFVTGSIIGYQAGSKGAKILMGKDKQAS